MSLPDCSEAVTKWDSGNSRVCHTRGASTVRELRISGTPPAGEWGDGPKSARCTGNGDDRNTITSLNSRAQRASCNRFGMPLALVCPSRARPKKSSRSYGRSAHRALLPPDMQASVVSIQRVHNRCAQPPRGLRSKMADKRHSRLLGTSRKRLTSARTCCVDDNPRPSPESGQIRLSPRSPRCRSGASGCPPIPDSVATLLPRQPGSLSCASNRHCSEGDERALLFACGDG